MGKKIYAIANLCLCILFVSFLSQPVRSDSSGETWSVLVLLGEWFGDAYFPLEKEIDARGWSMKRVGPDAEYRGCYNKARDIVLKSDILIKDLKDFSCFDCLIIPSGPQYRKFNENPDVLQFIRDAHTAGLLVASFCTGNFNVRAAGLVDIPAGAAAFPDEVTLISKRVLIGPRGGGPPPGDGFESAPVKELCDAIDRELKNAKDQQNFPVLKGPYLGQTPPGMTPEVFAPGFFSTEANEFNASFTPDGKEVYFTLDVKDNQQIMVIREVDGFWVEREIASFSGKFRDVDPYVSYDGERIYFSSNRSLTEMAVKGDCDFWFVEKSKDGGWGDPQHVKFPATPGKDDYYFMSSQSGSIYYSVFSEGTGDIYCIKKSADGFNQPVQLKYGINTEYNEHDPYIAPDERFLIFTSNRPGGKGSADLYISFQKPDHSWTEPVNMGEKINSDRYDYCPILSPDRKVFFFSSTRTGNGDVYWVDSKIIDTLKPNPIQ